MKYIQPPNKCPEFPKAKLINIRWKGFKNLLYNRVRIANALIIYFGPLCITIRRPYLPQVAWSDGFDHGYWAGKEELRNNANLSNRCG